MIILSVAVVNNPNQMNYNNWCEYECRACLRLKHHTILSRIKGTSSQWTRTKLHVSSPRGWKSRLEIFSAISRRVPTTSGPNMTKVLILIVNTSGLSELRATWCPPSRSIIAAGMHLFVRSQCEWRRHFNLPAGAVAVYWSEQSPLSSHLMSQEPPPYLELLR